MTWNRQAEQAYGRAQRREVKRLGRAQEGRDRLGQTLAVPANVLMDALAIALASGSGLLFGTTQDGGAVAVNLYVGDELHRGYATSAEDFKSLLDDVRDVCEARLAGAAARTPNARPAPIMRKQG